MILRKICGKSGRATNAILAQSRGACSLHGGELVKLLCVSTAGESFLLSVERQEVCELVRMLRRADDEDRLIYEIHQALQGPIEAKTNGPQSF